MIDITKRDTVLVTESGIYYTSKGDRFDRSKKSEEPFGRLSRTDYFNQRVCKNLKNPIVIHQTQGFWTLTSCSFIFYENCIEIQRYMVLNRVGDYKQNPHLYSGPGYYGGGLVIFKDGTAVFLKTMTNINGDIVRYVISPNGSRYNRLRDNESLTSQRNAEMLKKLDQNGHKVFLIVKNVEEIPEYYRVKSKQGNKYVGVYDGYIPDLANNKVFGVKSYDKNDKDLDFAPETQEKLKEFFQLSSYDKPTISANYVAKTDKEVITNWTDLLTLLYCPNGTSVTQSSQTAKTNLDNLINSLNIQYPERTLELYFDRQNEYILITQISGQSHQKNLLLLNTITGKKKIITGNPHGCYTSSVASERTITKLFSTATKNNNDNNWHQKYDNVIPHSITYLKSFDEVWDNTNIKLLLDQKPEVLFITKHIYRYNDTSNWVSTSSNKWIKIQDAITPNTWSSIGFSLLCSQKDVVCEQLIKTNNIGLLAAILLVGGLTSADCLRDLSNTKKYYGDYHGQMAINSKGKNAKEVFLLSNKQLSLVNNFCQESINKQMIDHPDGDCFSDDSVIPPLYNISKIIGDLNCLDLDTFQLVLNFIKNNREAMVNRRNYYGSHNLSDYSRGGVKEIMDKLSPKDKIKFMVKFSDPTTYNDYLNMRERLELLATRINRPDLWDPKVYLVRPNDDKHLQHLHDYISDIITRYQDAAKAAAFDKALKRVKDWEWIDEKEDLCIIPPKSIANLTREGSELHHCVGGFVEPIANGTTNVLFIRKKNDIETPYFTMEILNDGTVRQVHGLQNCNPTPEIVQFLLRWAKAHKNSVVETSIKGQYGALCANR